MKKGKIYIISLIILIINVNCLFGNNTTIRLLNIFDLFPQNIEAQDNKESNIPLNSSSSEIKIKKNADYFIGLSKEKVTEKIKKMGFSNIELVPLEPETPTQINTVKGVTIDSKSKFKRGDIYSGDVLVQIKYYDEFYFGGNFYTKAFHYKRRGTEPRQHDYTETIILLNENGNLIYAKHIHETRHPDRYSYKRIKYESPEEGIIKYIKDGTTYRLEEKRLISINQDGSESLSYDAMDLSSAMELLRMISSHENSERFSEKCS